MSKDKTPKREKVVFHERGDGASKREKERTTKVLEDLQKQALRERFGKRG